MPGSPHKVGHLIITWEFNDKIRAKWGHKEVWTNDFKIVRKWLEDEPKGQLRLKL